MRVRLFGAALILAVAPRCASCWGTARRVLLNDRRQGIAFSQADYSPRPHGDGTLSRGEFGRAVRRLVGDADDATRDH